MAVDDGGGRATENARLQQRLSREALHLFSRLPAVYAASRSQGQKFLKHGGGLSIVEWRTLWDLVEAGPLTIRELAAIQRADHSLLSRALPAMQDKGYVRLERDGRDGRQMLVSLAPAGEAAYQKAAPVMAMRRQALKGAFSDAEIKTFVALLDRFEEFLRQPIDDLIDQKGNT
jgi:DNA-binding MarR family transcriptional regulator